MASYKRLILPIPWSLKWELTKQMTFEETIKYDEVEAKKKYNIYYMKNIYHINTWKLFYNNQNNIDELSKWLFFNTNIFSNYTLNNHAIWYLMHMHRYDIIKWLFENYDITLYYDYNNIVRYVLYNSSNLEFIKWVFNNTYRYYIYIDIFRLAHDGKLQIIKLLYEENFNTVFHHTIYMMNEKNYKNQLIISSAYNGHLNIIKYLYYIVRLDISYKTWIDVIQYLAEWNHIKVIQWICENIMNKFYNIELVIYMALCNGHIKVVQWLHENTTIYKIQFKEVILNKYYCKKTRRRKKIIKFIEENYPYINVIT